ncbi:hypothetical protein GEOBC_01363 [Geobacteraceae bacterium]|nr:hypothetical protein GEOBC_01363 [Geobacteraceae bacterium]
MKTMIRFGMVALVVCLLRIAPAGAVSLDFVPSQQTVDVGQSLSVDLLISGLGSSVGSFDLDVSFDPAVLFPTGVAFGPFLGDPALGEALTDFIFLGGVVDLAEVSLLTSSELDALQPDSFTLATLFFDAVSVGSSGLEFSQALVDDASGIKLDLTTGSGGVNVVPEPGTFLLALCGLMGIVFHAKYRKRG